MMILHIWSHVISRCSTIWTNAKWECKRIEFLVYQFLEEWTYYIYLLVLVDVRYIACNILYVSSMFRLLAIIPRKSSLLIMWLAHMSKSQSQPLPWCSTMYRSSTSLYVVKTYPSIDPIAAPPIYKCQSHSPRAYLWRYARDCYI